MTLSYFQSANKLKQQGILEEAMASYIKAIEHKADFYCAHHNLGEVLALLYRWDEAIIAYSRAIELNPNSAWSHHNLGEIFDNIGCFDKAVIEYRRAIDFNPNFYGFYNKLGRAFYIIASLVDSEPFQFAQSLKEILNEIPHKNSLTNQLYFLKDQDFLQTTALLNNELFIEKLYQVYLRRDCDKPGKKHYLDYLENGITREEIVSWFRESPEFKFKFNLSIKFLCFQETVAAYRRSVELSSNSPNSCQKLGETLQDLGKIQEQQGQLDQAIESYREAISVCDNLAESHYKYGSFLWKEGKKVQAIESYKKAFALAPDWTPGGLALGYSLLQMGELEEASVIYKKLLINEPDNINLYNVIGSHFYVITGRSNAATYWKLALRKQHQIAEKRGLLNKGIRYLTETWSCRIGHIALLSYYAKMAILGWLPQKETFLFAPSGIVANSCFLNYFTRYYKIISDPELIAHLSPEAKYLEDYLHLIKLPNEELKLWWHGATDVQQQWESEGRPPLLTLTEADSERGWSCLQALGVPRNAWFVCIHVRESGFHQEFSDYDIRNADLDTYLLAIQTIVSRGGWVIRMGDATMKPLLPMKQVIDYAHSEYKGDWMDVFLCAKCKFFLGTNSGLIFVPPSFGVPCVWTNWTPLETIPWESQSIFIPKLYWRENEKRYTSFAEKMSPPLAGLRSQSGLSNLGIITVENTPEEINEIVVEMFERLEGTVKYTKEDEHLQAWFKRILESLDIAGVGRMGKSFLSKYADLLKEPGN